MNNQTTTTHKGYTKIVLYKTTILVFGRHVVCLNSGGHRTALTKRRLNQASVDHRLGFEIVQIKGDWKIRYRGNEETFRDNMILPRTPRPLLTTLLK